MAVPLPGTAVPQLPAQCLEPLRTGPCQLGRGHRGRCTTAVFHCDTCGKARRGRPHYADKDAAVCFLCCAAAATDVEVEALWLAPDATIYPTLEGL